MTPTWAGIVATGVLGLVCCIAGLTVAYVHMGRALKASEQRKDARHVADVQAWKAMPDRPLDGSDVDTQLLKPVPVVRREPLPVDALVERAEAAGRAAEARVKAAQSATVGRHRANADSDPLMRALVTVTQAMFVDTLVAAGETPPSTFGPPEPMHRRIVWTDETGWQQPELEVGI